MGRRSRKPAPEPPEHLSPRAQAIWSSIAGKSARSPGRLATLQAALEALDRADECRKAVGQEGLTWRTETTGAFHVHPLLKVEKDSRAAFHKIFRDCGFCWIAGIDGPTA